MPFLLNLSSTKSNNKNDRETTYKLYQASIINHQSIKTDETIKQCKLTLISFLCNKQIKLLKIKCNSLQIHNTLI